MTSAIGRRDPIEIVPYDGGRPAAFEEQRDRAGQPPRRRRLTGPVEHIASTSSGARPPNRSSTRSP
jgi:hypothetical protein